MVLPAGRQDIPEVPGDELQGLLAQMDQRGGGGMLKLKASTCFDCIATEHLDYFAVDDLIKDEAWYQYIMSHPEEGKA